MSESISSKVPYLDITFEELKDYIISEKSDYDDILLDIYYNSGEIFKLKSINHYNKDNQLIEYINNFNEKYNKTYDIDTIKKIIDIMPTFNTNIVSYENPTDKHPNTYGSTYNIQDVSNNYIYFRYPNQ